MHAMREIPCVGDLSSSSVKQLGSIS
jgi:hypothetical protein